MKKYVIQGASGPTTRIDYRRELNEEQRAVVTRGEGPALVIAGAGSGKTRVITYRVAWLLEHGVDPGSILLMTFTNKAAREMLSRVDTLMGGANARAKVVGGTFHHVGNLVLRRNAGTIGYTPGFTILDPEDRQDLIKTVLGECAAIWKGRGEFGGKDPLTEKRFPSAAVLGSMISAAINRQKNLSEILAEAHPYFAHLAPLVGEVAIAFAKRKRERDLMDFDDLLLYWKRLLETDDRVREAMRARFRHVLVDEYQDTNKLQADVVDLLGAPSPSGGGNVMVVGDDCQSIYSFRGAHFANIMEFPKRYPGCAVHRLETNYRSTPEILSLANAVIERNTRQFEKVLRPSRASGAKPALVPARDVGQQAAFVAQRILELRDEGTPLSEIAVLYRSHSHSLEVQVELARRGIPYDVRSGLRFFERAHIKDVLAHLRIVANPRDEVAWNRVVRLYPKIGTATAERIWRFIAQSAGEAGGLAARFADADADEAVPAGSRESWRKIRALWLRLSQPAIRQRPADLIDAVLQGDYVDVIRARFTDANARIEDLQRLAAFSTGFPDNDAFLADVTMLGELGVEDDAAESEPDEELTLSTVHRAKGLEWKAVFVIWTAEGHFPSAWGLKDPEGEEEERRLFYVATTRAKDELYLVYPSIEQRRDGRTVLLRPSRFVGDLDRPQPFEQWQLEEAIGELPSAARAALPAAPEEDVIDADFEEDPSEDT